MREKENEREKKKVHMKISKQNAMFILKPLYQINYKNTFVLFCFCLLSKFLFFFIKYKVNLNFISIKQCRVL